MSEQMKLKPCPFCGCENPKITTSDNGNNRGMYRIFCSKEFQGCGIPQVQSGTDIFELLQKWNTRVCECQ